MAQTIHLDANQVPAHLRGDYTGRAFSALVTASVNVPSTAGVWSGGSRDVYRLVKLDSGESLAMPDSGDVWPNVAPEYKVDLVPGVVMVRDSHFAGKRSLTFYVHPDNAAAMLPAPSDAGLSEHESIVLALSAGIKSEFRREYAARAGLGAAAYDAARASLRDKGLLTAAFGLTTKGKNVASQLPRDTERKAGV